MIDQEEIRNNIIKKYKPWNQAKPEKIKLSRLTGITNTIFKAELQGDSHPIIYRKFGESKDNLLLSRSEQAYVYAQMSKSGDGPKVYYYDQKMRIEEFIDSSVLQTKNMLVPQYLDKVAYTLAHFHKSKPTAPQISKQNLFRKSFLNDRQKVLKLCKTKLQKGIYSQQQKKIVQQFKSWVTQQQLAFLQKIISKCEQEWELVFAHNDLLANNIIIRKDNNQILFIDFQYAAYNFPFYDIANYFEETLIDYKVKEPPFFKTIEPKPQTEDSKLRFIDAYAVANDYSLQDFRQNFQKVRKQEKYKEKRQKLATAMNIGRLLCSFVWGWWSIMVSKNPNINFDYIKFAQWRYQNYQSEKKNLKF